MASPIRCTEADELKPSAARSNGSTASSIWISATPPDDGGGIDNTRWPRYSPTRGARSTAS